MDVLPDPTLVIAGLAALAVGLGAAGLLLPYLRPDPLAGRLKAAGERRRELRARQLEVQQRRSKLRRDQTPVLRRLVDTLKLREALAGDRVRQRLVQAGWRGPNALAVYLVARLAGPVLFGGLTAALLYGGGLFDLGPVARPLAVAAVALFAFALPAILTTNAIQRRHMAFAAAFPDALDLLLICVESGLSLEGAFGRVAQELGQAAPVMAEEFELTTAELAYLTDRRQALENFHTRVGLPAVKAVCTTMIQAEKYGTPLARALAVAAQDGRDSRMAAAEKKAAALPAKLTVPMIVFFLPVLFVIILGPAIIQVMMQ